MNRLEMSARADMAITEYVEAVRKLWAAAKKDLSQELCLPNSETHGAWAAIC